MEAPRDFSRDRPLPGTRRAVDGDDQAPAGRVGSRASRVVGSRCYYPPACGGVDARRCSLAILLLALVAGYFAAHDYVRGAAFVVQAADMQRNRADRRRMGNARGHRAAADDPVAGAASFLPASTCRRPTATAPSCSCQASTRPAWTNRDSSGFARDLASMGHPVVTVGPPDLARYTISPETTDAIEDAAVWLSQQRDLAPDGRIGMMGISFAGGLSIVAAGRPALQDHVAEVAVDRRARRPPADASLSLHGNPGRRDATAAARLRRGDHPARCGRPAGAGRAGAGCCARLC